VIDVTATVETHTSIQTAPELKASWPVDDLGPDRVLFLRLTENCRAVVVTDNVALGPAIGGVRATPGVDAAEVARLARAMSIKNAAAGLPHGGAKAGISVARGMDAAVFEQVIRDFAVHIREVTEYIPGPDMGTDETAMAWVHDEIGRAVGLPEVLGGIPLDLLGATGFGLAVCAEALQESGHLDLAGARVVVQGFGAVGRHAALRLVEQGAVVVAVADSRGATYSQRGLDIPTLAALKTDRSYPVSDFPGGTAMPRDAVLGWDCDVFVPAAQPDVITERNVGQLKARVILQGANIPITPQAEQALHQRGVLNIPDVIANAGGVICAAVEYAGGDRDRAFATIRTKIRGNTLELLDRIRSTDVGPRTAALGMARERLAAAEQYRRHF
jgi:glutamate dehydrogenase/leucine dehydrogenase